MSSVIRLEDMSREEKSLLLYLETRCVDYGGVVSMQRMNAEDLDIVKRWASADFIAWGRIVASAIQGDKTHWCYLGVDAWRIAQTLRQERAMRNYERRCDIFNHKPAWLSKND